MRNLGAEIQPAVDLKKIAKSIRQIFVEIEDGERLVSSTVEKLKDRRLRVGRELIEARKGFGKRGDGFREFVEKEIGRPYRTAIEMMKDAGYDTGRLFSADFEKPALNAEGSVDLDDLNRKWEALNKEEEACLAKLGVGAVKPKRAELALCAPDEEMAAPVVSENWADDMEGLADRMVRASRSLFSAAEQLDLLCRQRAVAITAIKFASIPDHLIAAQASIAATLRFFKGGAE